MSKCHVYWELETITKTECDIALWKSITPASHTELDWHHQLNLTWMHLSQSVSFRSDLTLQIFDTNQRIQMVSQVILSISFNKN